MLCLSFYVYKELRWENNTKGYTAKTRKKALTNYSRPKKNTQGRNWVFLKGGRRYIDNRKDEIMALAQAENVLRLNLETCS